MTTYRITNRTSGHTLGDYEAASAAEALDALARDAGYRDQQDAKSVAGEADLAVEPAPRYFVARSGRAFSYDRSRAGYVAKVVEEGGEHYVLAWDSIAGHYTSRHSLTRRQQARIIREARPGPDPIDDPEEWGL